MSKRFWYYLCTYIIDSVSYSIYVYIHSSISAVGTCFIHPSWKQLYLKCDYKLSTETYQQLPKGDYKLSTETYLLSPTGFRSFSISLCPSWRTVEYNCWYVSLSCWCFSRSSSAWGMSEGYSLTMQSSTQSSTWSRNWDGLGGRGRRGQVCYIRTSESCPCKQMGMV